MYRLPGALVGFLLVGWVVGCGDSPNKPPVLVKVGGTVKLDSKPMTGGEVRFIASGQPARIMEIKDGAFSGEAHVGKNQIDVVWEKDGPPHPMDPKAFIKVNVVADKYSGPKSALNAEVSDSGNTDFKFEVTSAPK